PTVLNVLFDERLGGPQKRVLQVARELQHSIRTIVVIPTGKDEFAQLLLESGIPVRRMPLKRLRDTRDLRVHIEWLARFWPNVCQLASIIRREHVDIVHTNGAMHLQSAIAAKLTGTKLVWHLNDVNPRTLIRLFFLPFVSLMADEVVVSSRAVGACYFGAGLPLLRRTTFTLYAPVDVEAFSLEQSDRIESELELRTGVCVIGTIGNISPIKGHRYFIEAAQLIKKQIPRARFLIIGKKLSNRHRYIDSLQELAMDLGLGKALLLTGQRTDVPNLLQSISVYVHTSLAEACPMAVLEAMAAGKPIVATSVGGIPEVVGDTAILVPPRDPGAVADAVVGLCKHPDRAERLGLRARERAENRFSLEECVRTHTELYQKTLKETPAQDSVARDRIVSEESYIQKQ
ncbi:MAG: glycosyltransferase, partial [bacterium]